MGSSVGDEGWVVQALQLHTQARSRARQAVGRLERSGLGAMGANIPGILATPVPSGMGLRRLNVGKDRF
ncbi:hypothetical protein GCM10028785_30090 [Hydrogenophaga soli]